MERLVHKRQNLARRKADIRSTLSGDSKRPRLAVYVSHQNVTAQLVDDAKHTSMVYVSSVGSKTAGQNLTEKASWVGTELAKKARAKKYKRVVFDRGGRLYHGRVKALAEAARKGGLEF